MSFVFFIVVVILGIWFSFFDVGDFILVRFYEECFFFVLFYVLKVVGMLDIDYFVIFGYLYKDG